MEYYSSRVQFKLLFYLNEISIQGLVATLSGSEIQGIIEDNKLSNILFHKEIGYEFSEQKKNIYIHICAISHCERDKKLFRKMDRHIVRLILVYSSPNFHLILVKYSLRMQRYFISLYRIFWACLRSGSSALSFECSALEDTFIRYRLSEKFQKNANVKTRMNERKGSTENRES